MRAVSMIAAGAMAMLLGTTASGLDTYKVDPAHTSIAFAIDHMVINTVHGRFRQFDGSIGVDPDNGNALKEATATIQAKSIDTDIAKRDDHLRSADFFDVDKFPTITFEGREVRKQGDDQVLVGKLTMHGVTREISLPFKLKGPINTMGRTRVALAVNAKLNRKDYGLTWNKVLDAGGLMVGNEVTIQIDAELVKAAGERK
ncbi:MAG TPA: YceI family protein [Verrucomicrobiae bacterium]|nr:YceI family protein [Verrucomicrobiae bacterium]